MKLVNDKPTDFLNRTRRVPPVNGDPWFTYAAIAACIGIFASIQLEGNLKSWDTLAKYGYMSPRALREGAIQGLFAPAFVHFDFLHVALNMYCLWFLGSRMERSIGTPKYILFYALATYVSSIAEFALTDETGIGASGVVYAIFGYMWIARRRHVEFRELIYERNVRLFIGWLFLCVPLTLLNVLPIANGAHFGGILFGMGTGWLLTAHHRKALVAAGLLLLFVLPAVTLFWCPWSPTWLSQQALQAQIAGDNQKALRYYNDLIDLDPDNSWAYGNRGLLHVEMGNVQKAKADWDRAGNYDPR